jgi:hypothetical protein
VEANPSSPSGRLNGARWRASLSAWGVRMRLSFVSGRPCARPPSGTRTCSGQLGRSTCDTSDGPAELTPGGQDAVERLRDRRIRAHICAPMTLHLNKRKACALGDEHVGCCPAMCPATRKAEQLSLV